MLIPVVLDGPPPHLAGSATVEQLQRALKGLAEVWNRPAIDPGTVTGVVDDATMAALTAALGILTEELPSTVYLALQGALIAGSTTSYAKNLVTQYAPQLTIAINTAITKKKQRIAAQQPTTTTTTVTTPPITIPTSTNPFAQLFAPGWYKQPFGIALIAIAAFGVYKLFLAPRPAPAAN